MPPSTNYFPFLCCTVLIFALFWSNVISLPTGPSEKQQESGTHQEIVVDDFSCYDPFNNAYIERIPHPSNCNWFMKCAEDRPGEPSSVLQFCPGDLKFNFELCDCDWPISAVCYNSTVDKARKFKCACPLIPDEDGNMIPDPDNDVCSNGSPLGRGIGHSL